MKKIMLTGGGTAGHVTPNLALIPSLKERGYEIRYVGSYQGIEKKLIEGAGIPYEGIASGKLRRYFDLKNFSDPFRVMKGYVQALKILKTKVKNQPAAATNVTENPFSSTTFPPPSPAEFAVSAAKSPSGEFRACGAK